MISATLPNKQTIEIDGKKVVRIRDTTFNDGTKANTLVDWSMRSLVMEDSASIAALVKADLPKLAQLHLPGGKPVWFNGEKASGPIFVPSTDLGDGCNSGFEMGNTRILVHESPEDVAKVIKEAGGEVLPLPKGTLLETVAKTVEEWLSSSDEVWR
ncbi:hypothetical protein [Mesorhizobium sp. M0058]|uniref:hypothetical protein n=1 Tax=Mesorhizobium sp. M0058 TaxID=2956865 RepID=UPI00333A3B4A